jgi:hypothetical protein
VSIKGDQTKGRAASELARGPNPKFYNSFHVQITDKSEQRILLEIIVRNAISRANHLNNCSKDEGKRLYAQRTLNLRGIAPQEKKYLWLALSKDERNKGKLQIAAGTINVVTLREFTT